MSTKQGKKGNNNNDLNSPALTFEIQNSKKQTNGSESSVTNNSVETEVSSINDSLTGSVDKDAFQSIFAGKLGKDAAQMFLAKNTLFPSHARFLPKNTENVFCFFHFEKQDQFKECIGRQRNLRWFFYEQSEDVEQVVQFGTNRIGEQIQITIF